ncbi:6829_t:CDS:10 [Ambispora gerdemannii]|uniref:6829_t:CDS:1 n=1 Tax=Ambispora gerdemannii TaxID=144530 RepID=A0A9N8V5B0_9GLOM|nr:6829_t:CDS:10 [Ambispora gerdemannii]
MDIGGIDYNSLPEHVQVRLRELEHEFAEGDITRQGFEKKKHALLAEFTEPPISHHVAAGGGLPPIINSSMERNININNNHNYMHNIDDNNTPRISAAPIIVEQVSSSPIAGPPDRQLQQFQQQSSYSANPYSNQNSHIMHQSHSLLVSTSPSAHYHASPPRVSPVDLTERVRSAAGGGGGVMRGQNGDIYHNIRDSQGPPPAIPPQHPGRGMRASQQVHHQHHSLPIHTQVPQQPIYHRPNSSQPQPTPPIQSYHPSPQPYYGPPPPVVPRPFRPPAPVNVRPPVQRPLPPPSQNDIYSPRGSVDYPLRNRVTEHVRSQLAYDENLSRGSLEIRSSLDIASDAISIKSSRSNTDVRSSYENELIYELMQKFGEFFVVARFQEDNVSIRSNRSSSIPVTNVAFKYGLMNGQNEKLGRSLSRSSHNNHASRVIATAPPQSSDAPNFDPELSKFAGKQFMPFEPRDIPFHIVDPLNPTQMMTTFPDIAFVFRHRGISTPKRLAFVVLDPKGKEVHAWTWEKLHSRAEKVAQMITKHRPISKGDRVALIYRKSEILDFLAAFYGCFLAGVVAVPINAAEEFMELCFILESTNSRLALTTEHNLKVFTRDLAAQRKELPANVEWWKTNELGGYHPKKKDDYPPIQTTDLAYIEYTKAPNGELKGVMVSHRTIMAQCGVMRGSITEKHSQINLDNADLNSLLESQHSDTLLTHLDPRQQVGLILGALFGVFCGNTTVYLGSLGIDVPGLWVNCISKYQVTIALADHPGLHPIVQSFKRDPNATLNYAKKQMADLSSLRLLFIDTLVVDPQRNDDIAENLLGPLGVRFPHDVITPMSSLPEHGGMILSFGDLIGVEGLDDRLEGQRQVNEFLIDREALKYNQIVVVAVDEQEIKQRDGEKGVLRVGAFGFVMPEATIAIVDPETTALCLPNTVGEVWVDSPSLSGAFWGLNTYTKSIFHAQPLVVPENTSVPELFEQEFLRTGLLGCLINGQLVVFGLYEDRIRQLAKEQPPENEDLKEVWEFHYTTDLEKTVLTHILGVNDCAAFQSFVNEEFLPILVTESTLEPSKLAALVDQIVNTLLDHHGLRIYCTVICPAGSLPRTWRNGKKLVNNMLCRKFYDLGKLNPVCVKTAVEHTVFNIPMGVDPVGGIWGLEALKDRQMLNSIGPGLRRPQYTGMEIPQKVLDNQTGFDLLKFQNIVEILIWRSRITPDDVAYTSLDIRGREGKPTSWKKLNNKIATIANYLQKKGCKPGGHTVLLFPHGLDYIVTLYACLVIGITPIPLAPPDTNRAKEDVPALLALCEDFRIPYILLNNDTEALLKSRHVQAHLKTAGKYAAKLPPFINITKAPKFTKTLKEANYGVQNQWMDPNYPALVLCYFSSDMMNRSCVKLGHDNLLAFCKVQKETCRMSSSKAIISCEQSSNGIGFVQSVLLGVYIGSPTILYSPADYQANPLVWFDNLGHFKLENAYATSSMLQHAVDFFENVDFRSFSLVNMKNLMLPVEGRPNPEKFKKIVRTFLPNRLEEVHVSYVYSHVANPMVTTRSHMFVKPFELTLDLDSLRREIEENMYETRIQDVGMVPISTQVAIVHPETRRPCLSNEFGEIWVASDANGKSLYGSTDPLDRNRFTATIEGGDPRIRYIRTGDLGFLHTLQKPVGDNGALVEFQCLFYLGPIAETFEVNGLMYFYCDIEHTIERYCNDKWPVKLVSGPSCVIFHTNGETVCVVEVRKTEGILNLVPAILKVVLEVYQFVLDIIVFLAPETLPRSRTGEKQRFQVFAGWVNKTLPTLHVHHVKEPINRNSSLGQYTSPPSDQQPISPTTSVITSTSNFDVINDHISSLDVSSLTLADSSSSPPLAQQPSPFLHDITVPVVDDYINDKNSMINLAEVENSGVAAASQTSNLLDDENWEQVEKVELDDQRHSEMLSHLPKMPISAIPEEPPQLPVMSLNVNE